MLAQWSQQIDYGSEVEGLKVLIAATGYGFLL